MQIIKMTIMMRLGGKTVPIVVIIVVGIEELCTKDVNDTGEGAELFWILEEVGIYFLFQFRFESFKVSDFGWFFGDVVDEGDAVVDCGAVSVCCGFVCVHCCCECYCDW